MGYLAVPDADSKVSLDAARSTSGASSWRFRYP
jgi:hypothetical protein